MKRSVYMLAVGLVAASGCAPTTAIVNGKEVPRLSLSFTGRPYSVKHMRAHPDPRGPSSGLTDDGGHVTGIICGLDLLLDVKHAGDRVRLEGFIDNALSANLEIRDVEGERVITGNLGASAGVAAVELHLSQSGLRGRVGQRAFLMEIDGDRYVGKLRINDTRIADATIEGREALWSMPAADQAAVLPALLTCFGGRIENDVRNPLVVKFGGEAGAEPPQTSTLYLTPTGF